MDNAMSGGTIPTVGTASTTITEMGVFETNVNVERLTMTDIPDSHLSSFGEKGGEINHHILNDQNKFSVNDLKNMLGRIYKRTVNGYDPESKTALYDRYNSGVYLALENIDKIEIELPKDDNNAIVQIQTVDESNVSELGFLGCKFSEETKIGYETIKEMVASASIDDRYIDAVAAKTAIGKKELALFGDQYGLSSKLTLWKILERNGNWIRNQTEIKIPIPGTIFSVNGKNNYLSNNTKYTIRYLLQVSLTPIK